MSVPIHMPAAGVAVLGLALLGLATPGLAGAVDARGSVLAIPQLTGDQKPELVLAQRTIGRSWGLAPGETKTPTPGWRSEGLAFLMSGVAPGSGQLYSGSGRAWWFAAAEVLGWATNLFFDSRADAWRRDAEHYAGSPSDAASAWSFERWENATGGDASGLRALYDRDREVFFDLIGSDPAYLEGWDGNATVNRAAFVDLRDHSENHLRTARTARAGLWLNHVLAAFDALRSARGHNQSLGPGIGLRFERRWQDDGLAMTAALERRF